MSCVARSYPRAEFEYQAFHEYDFDKKPQRKSKSLRLKMLGTMLKAGMSIT